MSAPGSPEGTGPRPPAGRAEREGEGPGIAAGSTETARSAPRAQGGAPSAPPPRSHPAGPAQQVAQAVRVVWARGGDRVTVQLEPEHLGKVHVVLAREAEGITAHFRVESAQAHQALTAEAPALRQALEGRGIPLVQVHVDMDGREEQRQGAQQRRTARKGARALDEAPESAQPSPGGWKPWGFDAHA
ncbi:MAG: hypothetical protein Kow0092_14670 [Deferrisomatales bacterium]